LVDQRRTLVALELKERFEADIERCVNVSGFEDSDRAVANVVERGRAKVRRRAE
jgi:hypothetical protein